MVRVVRSLKGAKMLKRTIGYRLAVVVDVTGVRSIREAKMFKILKGLKDSKRWTVNGINALEPLMLFHKKISYANNVLSNIIRFTAPNFDPTDAAPPSSGPAAPSGRRAAPSGRHAARSGVRHGGHPPGGRIRNASASVFSVAEFGRRLRDSESVLRDLNVGSPVVRLSINLLGLRLHDVGQALMTEGRATPALRDQLQVAKERLNQAWDQTVNF